MRLCSRTEDLPQFLAISMYRSRRVAYSTGGPRNARRSLLSLLALSFGASLFANVRSAVMVSANRTSAMRQIRLAVIEFLRTGLAKIEASQTRTLCVRRKLPMAAV